MGAGDDDARALALLDGEDHVVLCTADAAGAPWASPVAFAWDGAGSLYWTSSRSARHSENIRARADVALVLFATHPTAGLYLEARAEQIDDAARAERALPIVRSKPQPEKFTIHGVADVTGDAAWRIYRARAAKAWRYDSSGEESGQAVAARRPVGAKWLTA